MASIGVIALILFIIIIVLKHQRNVMEHDNLINEKEKNHQKVLLNASLEIAEQERAKIAANIHDDIGMMLHVLKLNITKVMRNLDDKNLSAKVLQDSNGLIEVTIDSIHVISNDLMPPSLMNLGFIEGMIELCAQLNRLEIIMVILKTDLDHVEMDKKNSLQLYRLIKEVMNNIVKHTKALNAEIEISINQNKLLVVVTHDGKGITNETIKRLSESSKGIGLRSILGRAQLINATVQYAIVGSDKSKIIVETPLS
jgi:signal transduction histidine kinase